MTAAPPAPVGTDGDGDVSEDASSPSRIFDPHRRAPSGVDLYYESGGFSIHDRGRSLVRRTPVPVISA
jgi:hypothetical protein